MSQMPFIQIIPREEASKELEEAYKLAENDDGTLDCVLSIHSQNPGRFTV